MCRPKILHSEAGGRNAFVFVLNLEMPGMNGFDFRRRLQAVLPKPESFETLVRIAE